MSKSKHEQRLEFCKQAAESGYTPSEYLELQKQASNWIDTLLTAGSTLSRTAMLGLLGGGALAGSTAAYGYNAFKNQFPEKFTSNDGDSPALKEEKIKQLIARYRNAAEDVRRQNQLYADLEDTDNSPMSRYNDFGGF
tara:strand:+ start:126 stop:539 length:414 start_codon:yes stop_codon:yes gene_type:complete